MSQIIRVAIVGAECSGKTSLANDLAKVFAPEMPSAYVPEYLRMFVDLENRTPRAEEQLSIAQNSSLWNKPLQKN